MINPYTSLGITTSATQEDIKKSYRNLVKKYHPDLNPGNKEAEKKFKEISHAFSMIGTVEARNLYDRGESEEQQRSQYDDFVGRKKNPSYYQTQRDGGRYSYTYGTEFGGEDFFSNIFGTQRGSMDFPGQDVSYKMEVDFKEAALGCEKIITLPEGKKLKIKIPAGTESGKKLRFKDLGKPGHGKGPNGDAYVEIFVRSLEGFIRNGKDIETELPISIFEAIAGGQVQVETLDGSVMLNIPPGVSSGTKLRIKGKGAGREGDRGSFLVNLKIVVPKNVDPSFQAAAENLKDQYNYNPRLM